MSIKQAIEALEEADALLALGFNVENQIAEALTALRSMPAEPLFYYRPCMGGLYEGPHHARSVLGKMLREERPNDWHPLYAAHVPEANFGNTPPTAPVPPDWSEVGRLLDAVSAASAGRYMVGTTNWAAFICRQMKQATPPTAPVLTEAWQPISTAPKDGRTLLLGYFNSHGKWRTMRGRWYSLDTIVEEWEESDLAGEGWYETVVESDDYPNCWWAEPTHWMHLPPPPAAALAGDTGEAR